MVQQSRVAGTIFESVCHLRVFRDRLFGDSYFFSSAAVYRGRYLLTAAHNVASNSTSGVRTIDASCGTAEFTVAGIDFPALGRDAVWVPARYSMTRRLPRRHCTDIAVVRLPQPLTSEQRFALAAYRSDGMVTVAGYPGGYRGAPEAMDANHLFAGSAASRAENAYLVNYDVLTSTGVSGGPVWEVRDGQPTIVAVHVGGTDRTARGRVITEPLRAEIDAVIDAWEAGTPAARLPAGNIDCG